MQWVKRSSIDLVCVCCASVPPCEITTAILRESRSDRGNQGATLTMVYMHNMSIVGLIWHAGAIAGRPASTVQPPREQTMQWVEAATIRIPSSLPGCLAENQVRRVWVSGIKITKMRNKV